MPCNPELLRQVQLFAKLDDDEIAVLAAQVDVKHFAHNQRIYKMGDPGGRGYVLLSGRVQVITVDEDHQNVVLDEPAPGEFFGFASMLEQKEHQTEAISVERTQCIEVDRDDILTLIQRKPHAGMDMLAVLGHQFHAAQNLVRIRANRNPNEIIEEEETFGERIADTVASFGGSWTFIILFAIVLTVYTMSAHTSRSRASRGSSTCSATASAISRSCCASGCSAGPGANSGSYDDHRPLPLRPPWRWSMKTKELLTDICPVC